MKGAENLRFPTDPQFYSKVQTSRAWKLTMEFILISGFAGAVLQASYYYASSPSRIDWVVLTEWLAGAGILAIIAVTIAVVRPFIVADGKIRLMRPVRMSNGSRKLVLSFDELANAELRPGEGRDVEVWVTLVDGTRFRMVTFDDDAGKEFARRLADHVRTLHESPPNRTSSSK